MALSKQRAKPESARSDARSPTSQRRPPLVAPPPAGLSQPRKPPPVANASLIALLHRLDLDSMKPALQANSIEREADVAAYTSGTQLRAELERNGKFTCQLHMANRLWSACKSTSATLGDGGALDLVDSVLSAATPAAVEVIHVSELPLFDALVENLEMEQHGGIALSCLMQMGMQPYTSADEDLNAEMNAEKVNQVLTKRGVKPQQLAGAKSARAARVLLQQIWDASEHANPNQPKATQLSDHETSASSADSLAAVLEQFQGAANGSRRESSLEDEAAAERMGHVARNPAALAKLKELNVIARTGDDSLIASAVAEAQSMHPELAALLHHEKLKIPEGTLGLNPPGSSQVSRAVARDVAVWAAQVQSVAPGATARSRVLPNVSIKLEHSGAVVDMVKAVWYGNLMSSESSGAFELRKLLDGKKSKSLLTKGSKKDGDKQEAQDLMLLAYPALVIAFEAAHPSDPTASSTTAKVGQLAQGNSTNATIVEGQREIIVPFMLNMQTAWERFNRGGDYPSCAAVWARTQSEASVQAWLTTAALRSAHSEQIAELSAALKAVTERSAKMEARMEKVERAKKPPSQTTPPPRGDDDGFEMTAQQKKAKRAAEHRERMAAKDAAAAAAGGAPAAAPSAAEPADAPAGSERPRPAFGRGGALQAAAGTK